MEIYEDAERFLSGQEFLASLRAIGATTPRNRHIALRPGEIRRVLRRFEKLGCVITYQIAVLDFQAAGPPC